MFKRNFDNAHHAAERRNSASFFDLLEETEGGEKETDLHPFKAAFYVKALLGLDS